MPEDLAAVAKAASSPFADPQEIQRLWVDAFQSIGLDAAGVELWSGIEVDRSEAIAAGRAGFGSLPDTERQLTTLRKRRAAAQAALDQELTVTA